MARINYSDGVKRHIAALVRSFGVTGAVNRLRANAGSRLSADRNVRLIPNRISISKLTATKYARDRGVPIPPRGRPVLV